MIYKALCEYANTKGARVEECALPAGLPGIYCRLKGILPFIQISEEMNLPEKNQVLAQMTGVHLCHLRPEAIPRKEIERRALEWSVLYLCGPGRIMRAAEQGAKTRCELAGALQVSEAFLTQAIGILEEKFGPHMLVRGRLLCFSPFGIGEWFS